jgi:iron complex outermembrane receptor protein
VAPGEHEVDFDAFTFSGNLSYRVSDGLMIYGSYSQGFKSGGFNQRYNSLLLADGSPLAYDEETAESFELGFKASPGPDIRINGAVFSNSYDDVQLTYRVGPAPLLFNAGNATIRGAELEMFLNPTDALTIDASLGYLDAKLDEVQDVPDLGSQTPSATSQAGDQLPRAPEFEFHIGASYGFDLGGGFTLTPRVDLNYRDAIWFDASNDIGDDSLTTMSGSLTLNNLEDDWRVTVSVENLTDELYLVAGTTSASTATGYTEGIYARPRNVSVTFVKDF